MMQVIATYTDDDELGRLRGLASCLGLIQLGRVSNRRFFKKVKFVSVDDSKSGDGDKNTKPNSVLERNRMKYSGE